ncbi:uncharacterized protein [Phyllobates terribilis]|uniref:uncharacterized protein n=1 Tax=Phyllobates terribilis TaxID=111132 RepID=UPI003CCA9E04
MLKTQRRTSRQPANRCEKAEFVFEGWDISAKSDDEDDLLIRSPGSSKWKCKNFNVNSLVISPKLYLKMSTAKNKADDNVMPFTSILHGSILKATSNVQEDKSKTKSSGPCTMKYSTVPKDINAAEKGNRVKRLLCITDNVSSRYKLDRSPNASEEKVNISTDQSERQQIASNRPVSILCTIHNNKRINCEEAAGNHAADLMENYKDAIVKLRGQNAWRSSHSNYSEYLAKSSFHGHIQTCILQLSNQRLVPPVKFLSCGDNSMFLKSANGKVKGFEGQSQRVPKGHHRNLFPASPVITMNKISRTDSEKFVWSQNNLESSKTGTCEDSTGLVRRIYPASSGKENSGNSQDVWGFPAFHPHPMKTQYSISSSSRGHTRSGKRNLSAPRLNSSEGPMRHSTDTSKDPVPLGGMVTVGLMLNAIRNGLKQDHIRVMLGQSNRFMEA